MKSQFKIVLALFLLVPLSCNKTDIKEEMRSSGEDTYEIVLSSDKGLPTKAGDGISSVEMTLVIAPNSSVKAILKKNGTAMTSGYSFGWSKNGSSYELNSYGSYTEKGDFSANSAGNGSFTVTAYVEGKTVSVATKTLPVYVNPAPKLSNIQITSPSSYIPYGNDYDVDVKLTYSDGTVLTRDDLYYNHCEDFLSASVSGSTIKVDSQDDLRIDGISGKLGSSTLSVTYNDGNSSKTASQSVTVYVAADLGISFSKDSYGCTVLNMKVTNLGSGLFKITSSPVVVSMSCEGEITNHTTVQDIQNTEGVSALTSRGWSRSGDNMNYQEQYQTEFELSSSINLSGMTSSTSSYSFHSLSKVSNGIYTGFGGVNHAPDIYGSLVLDDIVSSDIDYRQELAYGDGVDFSSDGYIYLD